MSNGDSDKIIQLIKEHIFHVCPNVDKATWNGELTPHNHSQITMLFFQLQSNYTLFSIQDQQNKYCLMWPFSAAITTYATLNITHICIYTYSDRVPGKLKVLTWKAVPFCEANITNITLPGLKQQLITKSL